MAKLVIEGTAKLFVPKTIVLEINSEVIKNVNKEFNSNYTEEDLIRIVNQPTGKEEEDEVFMFLSGLVYNYGTELYDYLESEEEHYEVNTTYVEE